MGLSLNSIAVNLTNGASKIVETKPDARADGAALAIAIHVVQELKKDSDDEAFLDAILKALGGAVTWGGLYIVAKELSDLTSSR